MGMDLHELLVSAGMAPDEDVKLYRHARYMSPDVAFPQDVARIIEIGDIEIFQSVQASRNLGTGAVAFFMAEPNQMSRFLGVWRVKGIHTWSFDSPQAEEARQKHYLHEGAVWHELEKDALFEKFENEIFVEWPFPGRPYHLWLFQAGDLKRRLTVHETPSVNSRR